MISLESAREHVLGLCPVQPVRRVPLDEALGCSTAGALPPSESTPPFDNTAVDGYAVRADDTAGARSSWPWWPRWPREPHRPRAVGPGEAIRIMTGAPIPPGADAVVMVEDTEPRGRRRPGAHRQGRQGGRRGAAAPGATCRPARCVLAAADRAGGGAPRAAGQHRSPRRPRVRRARVGVLSTGDELVDRGPAPAPRRDPRLQPHPAPGPAGRRRAASRSTSGVVRDDEAAIVAAIQQGAAGCDALVTTRRREHGRLRPDQGGARPHRPDAAGCRSPSSRPSRSPSGWWTGRPCSACPATRCRRWSASSCWPAPPCAR